MWVRPTFWVRQYGLFLKASIIIRDDPAQPVRGLQILQERGLKTVDEHWCCVSQDTESRVPRPFD